MKLNQRIFFNININSGQKKNQRKECLEEILTIIRELHWCKHLNPTIFIINEWTLLMESPDTLFHFLQIYPHQGLEIMQKEAYMKKKLK